MELTDRMDPEIVEAMSGFPIEGGPMSYDALPALRQMTAAMFESGGPTEGMSHTDREVSDIVTVRVYQPTVARSGRPCVFWIHGGGFIVGDFRMNDEMLDDWCTRFDCVAVSVEYRLAPEHPYPAALDDCHAALEWTFEHADELGIDTARLGIAGASAGGGLAAALTLRAHDEGRVPVAFQLLMAPMIDDRQGTESFTWSSGSREGLESAWVAYLGDLYGGDVPAYAAPSRRVDMSGLPPTFAFVGGADCFFDEVVEYATRLTHAGVRTELHVYPGAPHGFEAIGERTTVATRAHRQLEAWLAAQLGGPAADGNDLPGMS